MLCLYLQAPFAAFRTFTGGSFGPTAGFLTPSAAYGLLLNVAGVEMRFFDEKVPMTLIRKGLPDVRLAIAALEWPGRHTIFQQLHNYPIGTSGQDHRANTKGNKYNIVPVRREFLSNIKAYIGVQGNGDLESCIREGLAGRRNRAYGIPFLGDNSFLIDRLEIVDQPKPAHWFERIEEDQGGVRERITRVTVTIDRADASCTKSLLFAPRQEKCVNPPPTAWIEVNYP